MRTIGGKWWHKAFDINLSVPIAEYKIRIPKLNYSYLGRQDLNERGYPAAIQKGLKEET
ncbi:MAG: hypothetical protein ACFFCQ_03650 [Promethearchaeota archaeon]